MSTKNINTVKRLSEAEIRGQLLEGNFGGYNTDVLEPADPVTIAQIVLNLGQIKPYDKNPRQQQNPAYDKIKASILAQGGLNNAFSVTRRPGEEKYMVNAGGNTRLSILQELYAETRDERFNTLNCLYMPWTKESDAISAHFIENELRGEMSLIDKAYGIRALRFELEHELGCKLSDNEFLKIVSDKGFKISARQLRRLSYALDIDQSIPEAMRQGIIKHQDLDDLKKVEAAYLSLYQLQVHHIKGLFAKTLAEHDGAYFDFARVRKVLDMTISNLIGEPSGRITLNIDLHIQNTEAEHRKSLGQILEVDDDIHAFTMALMPDAAERNQVLSNSEHDSQPPYTQTLKPLLSDNPKNLPPNQAIKSPLDLPARYQRGYDLARSISSRLFETDIIQRQPSGVGFIVKSTSIPSLSLKPQQFCVYWLLMGLSAQALSSEESSDTGGLNYQLIMGKLLGSPEQLDDRLFTALMSLIENCRNIRTLL